MQIMNEIIMSANSTNSDLTNLVQDVKNDVAEVANELYKKETGYRIRQYDLPQYMGNIAYGGGKFILMCDSFSLSGTNGIDWERNSFKKISYHPEKMIYANGLYVLVSSFFSNLFVSKDGIDWKDLTTTIGNNIHIKSICYGNGLFVIVGDDDTVNGIKQYIATSTDGFTWIRRTAPTDVNKYGLKTVCYGNGLFVATLSISTSKQIITSTDGINWSVQEIEVSGSWNSVCYGNGLFVAVEKDRCIISKNGKSWAEAVMPSNLWNSVCYGNGLFVAVTNATYTTNFVAVSEDGINWKALDANGLSYKGVCYGAGKFMAHGGDSDGRILVIEKGGSVQDKASFLKEETGELIGKSDTLLSRTNILQSKQLTSIDSGSLLVDISEKQIIGLKNCCGYAFLVLQITKVGAVVYIDIDGKKTSFTINNFQLNYQGILTFNNKLSVSVVYPKQGDVSVHYSYIAQYRKN